MASAKISLSLPFPHRSRAKKSAAAAQHAGSSLRAIGPLPRTMGRSAAAPTAPLTGLLLEGAPWWKQPACGCPLPRTMGRSAATPTASRALAPCRDRLWGRCNAQPKQTNKRA